MYAVVATGGKQYRVNEGDKIRVEKLGGDAGSKVVLDQVLMLGDGEKSKIGSPVLKGAKVEAEILEQGRDKKIVVFKYKKRKKYRRKNGHRQAFTELRIKKIKS